MDMLPSLCTAMMRANGDSLVLESGRAPYVVAGTQRQDVAKATLSDNALEALVGQIFSEPGRQAFKESGFASEQVAVPSAGLTLSATVLRSDDGISIELKRTVVPAPEVAPVQLTGDDSLFAAPEQTLTSAVQLDQLEPSPGIFVEDSAHTPAPPPEIVPDAGVVAAQDDSWAQVDVEPAPQASTSFSVPTAMPIHESFAPTRSESAKVSSDAGSHPRDGRSDGMGHRRGRQRRDRRLSPRWLPSGRARGRPPGYRGRVCAG